MFPLLINVYIINYQVLPLGLDQIALEFISAEFRRSFHELLLLAISLKILVVPVLHIIPEYVNSQSGVLLVCRKSGPLIWSPLSVRLVAAHYSW